MAKFPRGHAATKKLIASCAANGVGIEGLDGAPRFRFIPAAPIGPVSSFTNGLPCGEPTRRGSTACGAPKPKHIKNWNPARVSLDPLYSVAMAGDDWPLTRARRAYAKGDPVPLRQWLKRQADERRASLAVPVQLALAA